MSNEITETTVEVSETTDSTLEANDVTQVSPAEAAATEVAATPAPVVTVPEEKSYIYQPTDEQGRSLGGKQVLKYRTQDELVEKLTHQSVLLVRKLREETRNRRLGVSDTEQIPDTAPRFEAPVDFSPRALTVDDRVKLSRDLLDPEKFDEASSTLFEATVGATPQQLRETLTEMQMTNLKLLAKAESDAFLYGNPEYFGCKENFQTITNWMLKNHLRPVRDNFQLAYDTLKAAGLLLEAPNVREEVPPTPPATVDTPVPTPEPTAEPTPANTQPVQDEPSRITTESSAQTKRPVTRVASGLTRQQAGDAGQATKPSGYTLAAIEAMPSEVYRKKLLGEPGFAATYERLLNEAQEAKKRR